MWRQTVFQKYISDGKYTVFLSNLYQVATVKTLSPQMCRQKGFGWTPLLYKDYTTRLDHDNNCLIRSEVTHR
jgi:hypothetical protein